MATELEHLRARVAELEAEKKNLVFSITRPELLSLAQIMLNDAGSLADAGEVLDVFMATEEVKWLYKNNDMSNPLAECMHEYIHSNYEEKD